MINNIFPPIFKVLYPVIAFVIGFLAVYRGIPTIIHVAKQKHLYDEPNERKATKKIVPTLGGVAIFIGFTLSVILGTNGYVFKELKYLIAAIIIMLFLGLKDDILILSATKKLFVQVIVALILTILGNFRFTSFHGLFGIYEINYITSVLFSSFVIIALTNAFNLIDGIDGLASGVVILVASVFGLWFFLAGHNEYGIMCVGLVGSLIAFFIYNVYGKKNKIFMGDTGSLILGTIMSVIVIKFNEFNINSTAEYAVLCAPVVSIGVLVVPVVDTLRVFFIRLSKGKSPFSPDMNHIHHRLLLLGNSHIKATSTILVVNALFVISAFFLSFVMEINNLLILVFVTGFAVAYIPSLILKHRPNDPLFSIFKMKTRRDNRFLKEWWGMFF